MLKSLRNGEELDKGYINKGGRDYIFKNVINKKLQTIFLLGYLLGISQIIDYKSLIIYFREKGQY